MANQQSTLLHVQNLPPISKILNRACIVQDNYGSKVSSYTTYTDRPLTEGIPAHFQISTRMLSANTVAIFRFKPKKSKIQVDELGTIVGDYVLPNQ